MYRRKLLNRHLLWWCRRISQAKHEFARWTWGIKETSNHLLDGDVKVLDRFCVYLNAGFDFGHTRKPVPITNPAQIARGV
jgi:uncharacterized damage-inducible protein DinB